MSGFEEYAEIRNTQTQVWSQEYKHHGHVLTGLEIMKWLLWILSTLIDKTVWLRSISIGCRKFYQQLNIEMVQVLVPTLGTSTLRSERVMKKTNAQLLQRINLYLNSVDYLKNTTWMYVYILINWSLRHDSCNVKMERWQDFNSSGFHLCGWGLNHNALNTGNLLVMVQETGWKCYPAVGLIND